jgi:hypothetical protein
MSLTYELIHGAMAMFAAIAAYFSYKAKHAVNEVHLSINSRMDQFLEEARKLARLQGIHEERDGKSK